MMLYCLCGRHQRALPSGLPAGPALHPLGSLTPDPQLLTQLSLRCGGDWCIHTPNCTLPGPPKGGRTRWQGTFKVCE